MIFGERKYLAHYGTPRHSGRYPWGSGDDGVAQRSKSFLDHITHLKNLGLTESQIAEGMGLDSVTQLRAKKAIVRNEQRQAEYSQALRLKQEGNSNVAIGEIMGKPESSVRALLAAGEKNRADVIRTTSSMLKEQVDTRGYIQIGKGVENHLGISKDKLRTSVEVLREEGYVVETIQVDQIGSSTKTLVKVLAPPGTTYLDVKTNMDKIKLINQFSEDGGDSFFGIHEPMSVDSKRIGVRWDEDGGGKEDGVIYVRPGVSDLSLGGARYAQVRVAVDKTHYIKGMAIYKDGLPEGTDLVFNTNKPRSDNKLDAFKGMKDDPENPFGSTVRQIVERDANGKEKVTSAMNIVAEEGNWGTWSKSLSSQFLSKQSPLLAKTQLNMSYENKKTELDDIMKLTNPAVKKKLLESFAEDADSSAVHLKAAHLPRQASHVIIPVNTLKETEVYAPNYTNGERVVLIRHPHGGTFEIPELVVNNNHPSAKRLLGNTSDAIGINHKVAEKLSGADFDGDTVLVIPNNAGKIKTSPTLAGLKNFDPKIYKDDSLPKMSSRTKGTQMGLVSNLITDMTIRGADMEEMSRAVRHSMVVIDSEKHSLNYKQSAIDNNIPQLMKKYQGRAQGGASTLISQAKSRVDVPERKVWTPSRSGAIDPKTGKKVFIETGDSYIDKNGKLVVKTQKSKRLAETDDASTLSSGTSIEKVYADYSNRMKALANTARKESLQTGKIQTSPSAKVTYKNEVDSLNSKLNLALKNAPLERQAQLVANVHITAKKAASPNMESDERKKMESQELAKARMRVKAGKESIQITDKEWDAIQAGAISHSKLTEILHHADEDRVKDLATPRTTVLMTSAKTQRAKAMAASGYTQGEIAEALGVSLTTLKNSIGG